MATKNRKRCLLCGKVFEMETLIESALAWDFFAELQKPSSFCPLCVAKIQKESEDTQKEPKPM